MFDGESGLRSKKAQQIIYDKFKIKCYADPFFKRNMVERAIKEVKLRMAILLNIEGILSNNIIFANVVNDVLCLGQPLSKWRNYMPKVIDTINYHHEKTFKSINNLLTEYFTLPTVTLPQTQDSLYKFKLGDSVLIDALPSQRKHLGFKYSLNQGKKICYLYLSL